MLVYRSLFLALHAKDWLGYLLVIGVLTVFITHIVANVGVAMDILPVRLGGRGFSVEAAEDGSRALARIDERAFDLVLRERGFSRGYQQKYRIL
jgi:hypothetical protein